MFEGLAIERLEKEWTSYPVLHFDMSTAKHMDKDRLLSELERKLYGYEQIYGRDESAIYTNQRLESLIKRAYAQTGLKVVILIDEYDAPLLDVVHEEKELPKLRDVMRNFYSPLKACDPYLRFVFLTGITKFSQLSIFSELNNIKNISMLPEYAALCGITEEEMREQMGEGIGRLADNLGVSPEGALGALKSNYDGYHFTWPSPDIYNPFSLLNAFDSGRIDDYWFKSGTPTYLIRLLRHTRENLNEMTGRYYRTPEFVDYKADVEKPLPMIYQSGYLTIKGYDREYNTFLLDFPNNEVKNGFLSVIASDYLKPRTDINNWVQHVVVALRQGKPEEFGVLLTSFLSDIPYTMRRKENERERERYFHYTFYLILRLVSVYTVYTEKQQSEGRVDCIVETDRYIYIFEFKLDGTAADALRQIEEKGYARPYLNDPRRLYRIGVSFSSETGTVEEYEVEPKVR